MPTRKPMSARYAAFLKKKVGHKSAMKNKSYRTRGKARPMRSLSLGYKGQPNAYRFVRETRPITIDLGVAGSGVSLIAGTGAIPNTSVFNLPNFQIDSLAGGFTEFAQLFANYKIDRIETVLIPQWQETVNPDGAGSGTTQIPNLIVTRINAKYLTNGYTLPATAEANRDKLAQVQKKTRSLYGNRKWLKLITNKPLVFQDLEDGSGGVNLTTRHSPWIPCATGADQQYCMNDLVFCDSLGGIDIAAGIYKYRYYHRCYFRTSFVG